MRKSAKLAAMKEAAKQKAIHRQMGKDLVKFLINFAGVAAGAVALLMLFGVQISWDTLAMILITFIIYKSYIFPTLVKVKG